MKLKKRTKKTIALKSILYIFIALLLALACVAAYMPSELLPKAFRYGLYIATDENACERYTSGMAVIADKNAKYDIGRRVVYQAQGGQMRFAQVEGSEQGELVLLDLANAQQLAASVETTHVIKYKVRGLGSVITTLNRYKIIVWAVACAVVIAIVCFELTSKKRRFKKARVALLADFKRFGDKYKLDDIGTNY